MKLLVLVMFLVGCNTSKGFFIHESVPADVRQETLKAAEAWNSALGYEAFIYRGTTKKEYSDQMFGNGSNVLYYKSDFDFNRNQMTGVTMIKVIPKLNEKGFNWDIILNANKEKHKVYPTILHEMGHALGLDHSDDLNDVMHPKYNGTIEISINDINNALKIN